jgi:DNA-binding NtrC family response regulator
MRPPHDSADGNTRATTLLPQDGPHKRRLLAFWKHGSASFDLPDHGAVTIGRGNDCQVRIDHPSVSRRHVKLHLGKHLRVEDLGSSNGTSIAGKTIAKGATSPVDPGMVIELGSAMLLVQGGDTTNVPHGEMTPPTGDADSAPKVASRVALDAPSSSRGRSGEHRIVIGDGTMEQLHRLAEMVAKSTISVILLGETGVGKEILAETIHRGSPRGRGPFVRLNCAALPDNLLESELFGYERGAFTGAVQAKPGLLEAAHGGTVFLDEVGELPLTTQAKLLRVLESGEVTRVGSLKPRLIDVRFLAATNRDLESLAASNTFRQDLYFRLNGISIQIPPLRERVAEIEPLANAFAHDACKKAGRPDVAIPRAVCALLERHDWPGNVRELKNVIERAVLLCQGRALEPAHISLGKMTARDSIPPAAASKPASATSATDTTAGAAERQRIIDALEKSGGNQKEAAKLLGISRRTLVYRLDTYGVPRPRKR